MSSGSRSGSGVDVGTFGLILDLDGTLVDSYDAITESLNHARAMYGLEPLDPATVRAAVGHGLEHLIGEWVGPDRIEDGVRHFRERYAAVFAAGTRPLPGVDATLHGLARVGYRMALASNKPARFSTLILRQLSWDDLFVTVEGPDTVGTTKPHPAMLRRCLDRMGTATERTLYVGDMPLDAVTGRRAGVEVVLVTGGSAPPAELNSAGSTVLAGLAALPAWLSDRGWPASRDAAPGPLS
ncbi:MAG: HAD-IA family hydrolase [Acidobacteria bacterium]|nr:HAD-IA family hydrolase [Acidobacteriota bacterium]NIM60982.1 HAD-IA family hydrolase [Acidobacteriota bacterium]NIO59950.1 HAD-IA family hydrolase [Acidobacteriota bacterium]NIQ31022.1 HAD-IA family hydrolase [Acidobacteriota bacterium]NIQ86150.1 HAD-IA family hydrolase [Acidobacteriota bacterium]